MGSSVRSSTKRKPRATTEETADAVAQDWVDEPIDGNDEAPEMAGSTTSGAGGGAAWETRLGSSMMTSKGQITVPAEVRERHGFKPGERVVFRELNGRIIVEPATASVDRLYGMLAHLAVGRPPATIEEMEEAAAAGWAREPIEPR